MCQELERLGVRVRHLDLPILRRAYRTPIALAPARRQGAAHSLASCGGSRPTRSTARPARPISTSSAPARPRMPRVIAHVQEFWSVSDRLVLAPLARRAHLLIAISRPCRALPPRCPGARTGGPQRDAGPARLAPLSGRVRPARLRDRQPLERVEGPPDPAGGVGPAGCPGRLTVLGGPPPVGSRSMCAALRRGLTDPESVQIVGEVHRRRALPERRRRRADALRRPGAVRPGGRRGVRPRAAGDRFGGRRPGRDRHPRPSTAGFSAPRDAAALAALLRGLDRERSSWPASMPGRATSRASPSSATRGNGARP